MLAGVAFFGFVLQKNIIFQKKSIRISGIVVPHHDLVKDQRTALFDEVAKKIKAPQTVIVVAPNHAQAGFGTIQTTDKIWNLSNGTLEPDRKVMSAIPASIETPSFQNEHGIFLILPDVKRVWPDARVVPLIIKTGAHVAELHDALNASCQDCLMIASVDFSHYQPAILAEEHDQLAIRALQNLDEELIRRNVEVDSPESLDLLVRWAESHGTPRLHLVDHTNSGIILNDPDVETTTHVFGWYQEGTKVVPKKRVSFLFGGDMMFARGIHATFEKNLKESVGHLGDRLFWGTDAAVINLEGAISATPVKPDPGPHFKFVFPPETVGVLKYLHVNAVSLDNNHANNGDPKVTRELLTKRDIAVLPATFQGEGLKLTVIGIHTLWEIPNIKSQITKIKEDPDQRVVVLAHWGVEYESQHSTQQQQLAHAWIDAGADMVIGSHPHVIQDAEVYHGKPIFYSLGNLLFDQDWSVATQQGMLIGGAFTDEGVELFGLPMISKNFQPELARGTLKQALLKRLWSSMKSSDTIKIIN
mgnify:CR=1 FL=1